MFRGASQSHSPLVSDLLPLPILVKIVNFAQPTTQPNPLSRLCSIRQLCRLNCEFETPSREHIDSIDDSLLQAMQDATADAGKVFLN